MTISGQKPGSASTGDIHLYVGSDTQDVSDARLLAAPVTQEVALLLGLDVLPGANAVAQDAWFDEVLLDNKPVTCTE